MAEDREHLYVFLHIPKCAGSTFAEHFKHNLGRRSLLSIGPTRERAFACRSEVDDYVASIAQHRRDEIRAIVGHSAYYGIHEHFRRPARYITFLRDPIDRTLSHYEYFLQIFPLVEQPDERFPGGSAELTLERWWETLQQPNWQTSMVLNYLIDGRIGSCDDTTVTERHLEQAKRTLDGFYFVGTTETFEEDSLYLYDQLGFRELIRDPVNRTLVKALEPSGEMVEMIAKGVHLDRQLYDHAVALNREFRRTHSDFFDTVERMKRTCKVVTPLRTFVRERANSLLGARGLMLLQNAVSRIRGGR
jgi:hypothetical protein